MKAVIMAGGEGSRLRPLTCACPKPMVPLLDRPIMLYTLELLKRHGIDEAAVTLMYLPQVVMDYFGDGSEAGVRLTYFVEDTPLGTAGSVLRAADVLDDTFVVLSGDGLTDLDLTKALVAHKEKNALATMVLKRVSTPIEYGVVVLDESGRVKRFVEKPDWGEVPSDYINTGIYILDKRVLERIPTDRAVDFGRELFPKLVEMELPVYGYPTEEYWCDVGDQAAYRRAHMDLLDGRVKAPNVVPGSVARRGAQIDKSAVLEAPCYIGAGAQIGAGARIGPYSVVASGATVGAGASVKRSILWRGARVDEGAQLRGCVLLSGAHMLRDACAFEESVLGDESVLGVGATLMPGARVWPRKVIGDHEKIDRNIVWGVSERRMEDGVFLARSPAQTVQDAQSFADALQLRTVVLGRDASSVSTAYQLAAAAGMLAQGTQVLDAGVTTLAQLRYIQENTHTMGALYITREGMTPLADAGAKLDRDQLRKIVSRVRLNDFAAPFSTVTRPIVILQGTDMLYIASLLDAARLARTARATQISRGLPTAFFSRRESLLSMAERVFRAADIPVRGEWEEELMVLAPDEIGVWLSDTGEQAQLSDARGLLGDAQLELVRGWLAFEMGADRLIAHRGMTRALDTLAERYHTEVVWTTSDIARFQRALAAEDETLFRLYHDGIFFALCLSARLKERALTLASLIRQLPDPKRRSRALVMEPRDKGALFKKLSEMHPGADPSDGLTIDSERGWAWISPEGDKKSCLVLAEAQDAETARELCDFYASRVEALLREK